MSGSLCSLPASPSSNKIASQQPKAPVRHQDGRLLVLDSGAVHVPDEPNWQGKALHAMCPPHEAPGEFWRSALSTSGSSWKSFLYLLYFYDEDACRLAPPTRSKALCSWTCNRPDRAPKVVDQILNCHLRRFAGRHCCVAACSWRSVKCGVLHCAL